MKAKYYLIILVFVAINHNLVAQEMPQILQNVPYSSVTKLANSAPDATYSYGEHESQYALYWRGKNKQNALSPIVIFIHGGCWLKDYDIRHSLPLTSALANDGFSVWSIEYRRTGQLGGGWPGSFDDIQMAIRLLFDEQISDVDYSRVILMGHSAGGHLAMLAASLFDKQITQAIGLAAITDLFSYAQGQNSCQRVTEKFMGGTQNDRLAQFKQADPRTVGFHSNTILLQGSEDNIVPVLQGKASKTEQILVAGAGHFDWIHPKTHAYSVLLENLLKHR